MATKMCHACGKPFEVPKARMNTAKYCSTGCRDIGLKKTPNQACTECGNSFHIKKSALERYNRALGVFCSYACTAKAKSRDYAGERNPNYKGRNIDEDGYRKYVPPASYLLGIKAKKLHQAVCCEQLGILEIPSGWHIHHRDCDILNNAPENLAVLTTSDHKWLHKQYGVATLWAYCQQKVDLATLVSWADDAALAQRLLPLNVLAQSRADFNYEDSTNEDISEEAGSPSTSA